MPHLSPTRVSIYDFLYQDTHPIVSLLADTAQLSLPQARQGLTLSLQACCFGLIATHHALDAEAFNKRLLQHAHIKKLRQYNAMNLYTMQQIHLNVHGMAATLFYSNKKATAVSEYLAHQIATSPHKTAILLDLVIGLSLRELSIIVDYAQLNSDEIAQWLSLQTQFLHSQRFLTVHNLINTTEPQQEPRQPADNTDTPPKVDIENWQTLLEMTLPAQTTPTDNAQANATTNNDSDNGLPSYAKAIGRTQTANSITTQTNPNATEAIHFATMAGIHIPYRRWLWQLAQVADVYLSRQRLKINNEPQTSPSRPLLNFGFLEENRPLTASESPFEFDKPNPFYKNPVILITVAVIGGLLLLAMLKYQHQQHRPDYQPSAPAVLNTAPSHDVVILKIDDDSDISEPDNTTDDKNNNQDDNKGQHVRP